MQLRHTFVLAAGTAAALAVGGAAFAAGNDDPRPQTPRVTSPSSTVRPSAPPTARPSDDHHRGRGTDDPAGDDRGGHRSASSPSVIRSTPTTHTITPSRPTAATQRSTDDKTSHRSSSDDRAADDHLRHSGSDDRLADDHGRHSGSDDRLADDHGRHSGRD